MVRQTNAAVDCAVRAAERAASVIQLDLRRGMAGVASITAVAPFFGFLITAEGIVGSFIGCGGEKWTCLAAVVDRLSYSIARAALGLAVGLLALLVHRYLEHRLEEFDTAMRCTVLEMANALSRVTPDR